uniref:Ring finger protein 213 n=1 Tax=Canis lupus dingo TaxID=286419 RepID=A0A8C0K6I9_CANLU
MRRSNGTAKPERVRLWGGRCEPWAPGHRHRLPDHPHPGAGDGESQATALLGDPSWGNGAPTQGAGWGASCVPIPCLVQCSWGLKGLPGTQRARWWRGERLACPQVLISPLPPLPPALQSWAERAPLQGDAPLPRHPTAEGGTVGPRGVVSVWSVDALALGRVEKRGSCCARACMCVCVCACACVCGCRGGGGRPEAHGCFLFWLSSSTPLSVQEGITVYFHAIIPKDCNVNLNSHQVYVRGGEEFGKLKWQNNVCEMHYTKDLHENGYLVEGHTVLSRQHVDKPIPYKYVIVDGDGCCEYEFIYKQKQKHGDHVNRCLVVRSELLALGDWHQYDDMVRMESPGKLQKLMSSVTDSIRKDLVKGKQVAATLMLDNIFSLLQAWGAINLRSFLVQFQQFFSVVRVPMIYEGQAQPWLSLKYDEKEVKKHLWEYLKNQAAPLLESSVDPLPEDHPVKSPLRMGLIVLFAVEKFNIPLSDSDLSMLCTLLCSNVRSPGDLHSDLSDIFETYQSWREALVNLCQKCMEQTVDLWVLTLPLLHYCMELFLQGKDCRMQPEDIWAALEGISFSEFREKRTHLVKLMSKYIHLLNVDTYLFRSWFSLVPLSNLLDYMENFVEYQSHIPACILDCLQGTWYRLQHHTKLSKRHQEVCCLMFRTGCPCFSKCRSETRLSGLLDLLNIYQDKILEEPLIQSYLTVCQKLHETICSITKDERLYELLALSAEIVCRIITLQPLVDSAEGLGKEARRNSVHAVFQGTIINTRAWLQSVFRERIFNIIGARAVLTFRYTDEIKVNYMVEGPSWLPGPVGALPF